MTTIIPTEYLVPERSFNWKGDSTERPVLEIVVPNEETQMVEGLWNFIIVSIGDITLTVMFVECAPIYASYLEGLVSATDETAQQLKKFIPIFRQEIEETKAQYAILFGGGPQGLEAQRALSYHTDEDEAIYEFKRVAEELERGNLEVLVDRISGVPLLRLEEGTQLLISSTSTAGNERISPN